MSCVAFVPVRIGSKGIPKKNIKSFCGKPLLYWVLNELENTDAVSEIILAFDDDEIKTITESFRLQKITYYKRSEENASDEASTESVILEYLNCLLYTSDAADD